MAWVHDAADALLEDGTYTYGYDAQGNLVRRTSKADPSKVTLYAYDAMNRLVGVQTAGGGTVTYAYDALGRRVAKSNNNGATTRYVLDGWNVRLELDGGTGSLLAANTHAGLDRLLVRDQGGASVFLHGDGLNSTTALTDAQGQVVERYRYAAFGKVEVLNADFSPKAGNVPMQPFTFTGREWEPESGLFFYRHRFYSAGMGRFISRDPIGESGGINLYSYAENNLIDGVDPLGLEVQAYYYGRTGQMSVVDTARRMGGVFPASSGTNNPAQINVAGSGPLPLGDYNIYPRDGGIIGHPAFVLDPIDNSRLNDRWDGRSDGIQRSSFRIHDAVSDAPRRGSDGCIVLDETNLDRLADLLNNTRSGPVETVQSRNSDGSIQLFTGARLGVLHVVY